MKSANPALTPALFDQLLGQGELTDDLGDPGRDDRYGFGLIDAQKAVAAALTLGGTPPPDNPLLSATPQALNFGTTTDTIEIEITNAGTGTLAVTGTSSSEPWVSIQPIDVDGNGLGTYVVTVDRSALTDGVYTAEIMVTSTVNSLTIPLIKTVGNIAVGGNVGHIYIALVDEDTGATVFGAQSDFSGGAYPWQMINAPAGNFLIVAGTDLNNDGFICDSGEACGEYITRDQPVVISVDRNLTDLDFPVNYDAPVTTLGVTTDADSSSATRAYRRTPTASQTQRVE